MKCILFRIWTKLQSVSIASATRRDSYAWRGFTMTFVAGQRLEIPEAMFDEKEKLDTLAREVNATCTALKLA